MTPKGVTGRLSRRLAGCLTINKVMVVLPSWSPQHARERCIITGDTNFGELRQEIPHVCHPAHMEC